MILSIISFFLVGGFSIVCHEVGHAAILHEYIGYAPRIRWSNRSFKCGEEKDYIGLSDHQLMKVYAAGIFAGFACILSSGAVFGPFYYLLIAPYIMGCLGDIGKIISLVKSEIRKV